MHSDKHINRLQLQVSAVDTAAPGITMSGWKCFCCYCCGRKRTLDTSRIYGHHTATHTSTFAWILHFISVAWHLLVQDWRMGNSSFLGPACWLYSQKFCFSSLWCCWTVFHYSVFVFFCSPHVIQWGQAKSGMYNADLQYLIGAQTTALKLTTQTHPQGSDLGFRGVIHPFSVNGRITAG